MLNKLKELLFSDKVSYIFMAFIFLWPFLNSFSGIDMGDTGLHTYMFSNLYETPELLSFTSWFTTFIGWAWLQMFGFLGLWGLNLLEVILEMTIVFIVYQTFKHYLNKNCLLLGLSIAILASNTYLNVFNYHQFNVLLLVIILCSEFKAITERNIKFSVIAGICLGITVFARTGSVTAFVTLILYFFWYLLDDHFDLKQMFKHLGTLILGFLLGSFFMILILIVTNQLDLFIKNIFRLKGLATETDGGYSIQNLLDTFFTGNLEAIGAGLVYFAGILITFIAGLIAYQYKYSDRKNRKRFVLNILIALVFFIVGVYIVFYSFDVNPAPSWPQMTTGPSFFIGVMYVSAMFSFCYNLRMNKNKCLIILMSIFLPMLTIAGSNTGTKHVIIGLWIIAPIFCNFMFKLFFNNPLDRYISKLLKAFDYMCLKKPVILTFIVAVALFTYKLGNTVYLTNNFDSIDRTEIRYSLNSENVKFLKTSERQAINVNGVLDAVEKVRKDQGKDIPMIVYGGSVLFYYLTDSKAYVQPWITLNTYPVEQFKEDLKSGKTRYDKMPVIIYGRTNNYYGFYEEKYEVLMMNQKGQRDNGKKQIFADYLINNDYGCVYENEYYVVFSLGVGGDDTSKDYINAVLGLE